MRERGWRANTHLSSGVSGSRPFIFTSSLSCRSFCRALTRSVKKRSRHVVRAERAFSAGAHIFGIFSIHDYLKPSRLRGSCRDSNNNRPVPVVNPSPSNFKHARRSCEYKPRPVSNHETPLRVLAVKRGFNLKGRMRARARARPPALRSQALDKPWSRRNSNFERDPHPNESPERPR